jgi:hypothetical protein
VPPLLYRPESGWTRRSKNDTDDADRAIARYNLGVLRGPPLYPRRKKDEKDNNGGEAVTGRNARTGDALSTRCDRRVSWNVLIERSAFPNLHAGRIAAFITSRPNAFPARHRALSSINDGTASNGKNVAALTSRILQL